MEQVSFRRRNIAHSSIAVKSRRRAKHAQHALSFVATSRPSRGHLALLCMNGCAHFLHVFTGSKCLERFTKQMRHLQSNSPHLRWNEFLWLVSNIHFSDTKTTGAVSCIMAFADTEPCFHKFWTGGTNTAVCIHVAKAHHCKHCAYSYLDLSTLHAPHSVGVLLLFCERMASSCFNVEILTARHLAAKQSFQLV